ncbi:MAG: hypothetical protein AAFO70_09740 [Pseudomonadota bacterium]
MKFAWGWIIAALWAWILIAAGGEGHIFPAASIEITKMNEAPDAAYTRISGRVNRLRPNCSFRSLRWYLGERHGPNVPTTARFLASPKVRADGWTPFGPWEVGAPLGEMRANRAFADAYHQCTLLSIPLPWLTRSKIWN